MRISILTQEYAPEEISSAVLAQELAEALASRGHDVTVITRAPNYPLGKLFPGYRNRLLRIEHLQGVRVIRVWSHITPKRTFWHRVFIYATFSISALAGGLLAGKRDVLLCYSPPLPLAVTAWILSRLSRKPWILRVEDLFPEAAVAGRILTSRPLIWFFERLAQFLYRHANAVSLITEGFRGRLLALGISAGKLGVIPVWADPLFVKPLPKDNEFRHRHGLDGKFVVLYAGTMGHTSALEDVLEAARFLMDQPAIHFVFVGEGVKTSKLIDFAHVHELSNVTFLPFQPRSVFPQMLAAADIGVATLNAAFGDLALPHKVFSIMASGRPVVAVTPPDSDLAALVRKTGCGIVVMPDSPRTLAATIARCAGRPEELEAYARNGRERLLADYSREHCIGQFEQLLSRVARTSKHGAIETGSRHTMADGQ